MLHITKASDSLHTDKFEQYEETSALLCFLQENLYSKHIVQQKRYSCVGLILNTKQLQLNCCASHPDIVKVTIWQINDSKRSKLLAKSTKQYTSQSYLNKNKITFRLTAKVPPGRIHCNHHLVRQHKATRHSDLHLSWKNPSRTNPMPLQIPRLAVKKNYNICSNNPSRIEACIGFMTSPTKYFS